MPSVEREPAAVCTVVRFVVAHHDYVAEIERIREIIFYRPSVPVPHAPAFLEGVIDLRGRVIPLIDLRERLGIAGSPDARPRHILVVEWGDRVGGLVVDEVRDVVDIARAQVQLPEAADTRSRLCRGVCRLRDDLLLLVDLDAVLSPDDHVALAGVV
jgi:purine-binding chemotaxis protein CheW